MLWKRFLVGCLLSWFAVGCSDGEGPGPTRPGLTLTVPTSIEGLLVTCETCEEPSARVVIDVPVTVGDPRGTGGTLDRLETVVANTSRGVEIGRNVRPNADYAFPSTTVPAGGSLTVRAGVVFAVPPPRDEIRATIVAHLGDGRSSTATAPIVIVAPAVAQ